MLAAGFAAGISPVSLGAEPPGQSPSSRLIYVVRHAERADDGAAQPSARMKMGSRDPDLSAEGHARARRLASMLRDAGITRIFATEYRRTRQTAEPLASLIHVGIETAPATDLGALIERVSTHGTPLLIVGHSNTVPDILRALGVGADLSLGDDEYDNLFVVVRSDAAAPPALVRLRY